MAYDYYYTYDAAGNRTSWQVVGGSTTDYTYDAANKMLTAGDVDFTYSDNKGNLTQKVVDQNTTTYTWDYENRMTQWASTGQTTMDFVYNGDGMRVRKTPSGGTATNFLLDGDEIVEEITGDDVTSYMGPGLISKIISTTRTIYHADGIGSTRAMTDSDQAVTMACIYDAYGNLLAEYPGSSAQDFGYAGEHRYYADVTGLCYLKARYYDPATGRFISRDPIGYKSGLNLYEYVNGNPVSKVDPTGLLHHDFGACMKECITEMLREQASETWDCICHLTPKLVVLGDVACIAIIVIEPELLPVLPECLLLATSSGIGTSLTSCIAFKFNIPLPAVLAGCAAGCAGW